MWSVRVKKKRKAAVLLVAAVLLAQHVLPWDVLTGYCGSKPCHGHGLRMDVRPSTVRTDLLLDFSLKSLPSSDLLGTFSDTGEISSSGGDELQLVCTLVYL